MKDLYIYSISSITNQDSFENPGFSSDMKTHSVNRELIHPEYKEFIPLLQLRRMPKLSRMGIATSVNAMKKAAIDRVGAIIVGSALGSLDDTERFLQKYIPAGDSLVPPVSFIQSGHNTVSGQIALFLSNHSYNMTHVQQNLSFEHALIDSSLFVEENHEDVLLGALDEKIPLLNELAGFYGVKEGVVESISEGCTFMLVGEKADKANARIVDVETEISTDSACSKVKKFLERNKLELNDLDQILVGSTLRWDFKELKAEDAMVYTDYCGQYFTSSAFACHIAFDLIQSGESEKILILNGMADKIGLILLSNV